MKTQKLYNEDELEAAVRELAAVKHLENNEYTVTYRKEGGEMAQAKLEIEESTAKGSEEAIEVFNDLGIGLEYEEEIIENDEEDTTNTNYSKDRRFDDVNETLEGDDTRNNGIPSQVGPMSNTRKSLR